MALACANVAAASFADTTGGDPVAIPSHTTVTNQLYTFVVVSSTTATVSSITLAGTGTEVIIGDVPTAVLVLTYGYMFCTAGATDVGSIDFSGATTGVCFSLDTWTGIDLADPVIDANFQEGTGSSPVSITLPNALAKATNAIWGGSGWTNNSVVTEGTDYTETFDAGHGAPTRRLQTQYDISPPDLVFDCSQAGNWAAAAFEINEATAAGTEDPYPYLGDGYFPVQG